MAAPVSWRRLLNSVYSASSPAVAGVFSRITDRLFRAKDRRAGKSEPGLTALFAGCVTEKCPRHVPQQQTRTRAAAFWMYCSCFTAHLDRPLDNVGEREREKVRREKDIGEKEGGEREEEREGKERGRGEREEKEGKGRRRRRGRREGKKEKEEEEGEREGKERGRGEREEKGRKRGGRGEERRRKEEDRGERREEEKDRRKREGERQRSSVLLLAPLLAEADPAPPPRRVHRTQGSAGAHGSSDGPCPHFRWMSQHVPAFRVPGTHIHILTSPDQFYQTMKARIRTAQKRVVMASLYLGTGKLEQELVDCLEEALERSQETSSKLRVSVLLDYTRGSRGAL
ncbi:hypothetical protein WMY93_032097 [Mugilogobius chulae]|uniref:CDP-diacylglycerol--glycerol-3-phosphate 3-phosphatidyltransferase n=1 Tax=Mugilogobius chulae TaxID=88201 RepID=A0AAW0MEA7_9GOBI